MYVLWNVTSMGGPQKYAIFNGDQSKRVNAHNMTRKKTPKKSSLCKFEQAEKKRKRKIITHL